MTLYWALAAMCATGLVVYLIKVMAIRSHCKNNSTPIVSHDDSKLPGVSILKPLKGLDDNLFDNLQSFCKLDYPSYELIFAMQDRADPAYKVAMKVKDKNPQCDIKIHIERCGVGLNPKVNNLIPAYRAAQYECILISDSNVKVSPNYLRSIAYDLGRPGVGMVTNLIRGIGGRSLWAVFENLHMNSFVIGGVSFLDKVLGHSCVVGKSMLMRKSDLDAIGGLEAVKNYLAEDYMMGKLMVESGRKVVVSGHLIDNVNERWGMKKFLNRHTRWGKLRRRIGGGLYASELFDNPVFLALMPTVFMGLNRWTVGLLGATCAVKIAGDLFVGRILKSGIRPLYYAFVPVKDVIIGCMWFVPIVSSSIQWRDNNYKIGPDSILSPCTQTKTLTFAKRISFAVRSLIA